MDFLVLFSYFRYSECICSDGPVLFNLCSEFHNSEDRVDKTGRVKEMCMYACMLVCTHNLRTFLSLKIYAHIVQLYTRIF